MNRILKISLGIGVIVAAIIYWTFQSLEGNEIYYLTVKELKEQPEQISTRRIKLGGIVKAQSIQASGLMSVEFELVQDEESIPVKYEGVVPDMFKDEAEVIVEGTYTNNTFIADNLIAKCASKYETNFEHENGRQMPEQDT